MYCKELKYNEIHPYAASNVQGCEASLTLPQLRVDQTLQVANILQLEHLYV